MRRLYKKTCPVCGAEFEGIARRIYDKPSCQVKAYRRRKRAEDREEPGNSYTST